MMLKMVTIMTCMSFLFRASQLEHREADADRLGRRDGIYQVYEMVSSMGGELRAIEPDGTKGPK